MLRKTFYILTAGMFLVSCASDYEAEKAVTKAEMSGSKSAQQQSQNQQEMKERISKKLRPVYFDVGSAKLTERFKNRLDKNVEVLKENQDVKVYLTGHADSRGADARNWELAMKRAKSVEDYIVSQGVSRDRIYTISKGENDPKVTANDESYYQINRRVEFEPFTTDGSFAE